MLHKLKIWLAGHLHHLGWGCFGQECDCGFNRFNWLARTMKRTNRFEGDWDWEKDPEPLWFRVKFRVGSAFIDVSRWLDPEAESM